MSSPEIPGQADDSFPINEVLAEVGRINPVIIDLAVERLRHARTRVQLQTQLEMAEMARAVTSESS